MLSAATIFLSAFLLFGVQPLIARQITPWFGGSAAVWSTCMLFFQVVLLLGYGYSHLVVNRFGHRLQARVHQAVVGLSLLSLPILPGSQWKPTGAEDPTWRVLLVLAVSVGLPYWTLSTTNPLLGAWFARRYSDSQSYRLFALSNLGALLALLTYPTLCEPSLTLRQQAYGWSALYLVFAVLVVAVAQRSAHDPIQTGREPLLPGAGESHSASPPGSWIALGWVGLSACSCVLLISLTNYLTQNVAAIPFLWVVPLALYLISYIFTFSYSFLYQRWLYWPLAVGAFWYLSGNLSHDSHNQPLSTMIPLICGSLFTLCMLCHGELARSKPDASQLTRFYLMSSAGGALGGIFVGIISPLIFADTFELPLVLWLAPLLAAMVAHQDGDLSPKVKSLRPVLWCLLITLLSYQGRKILPQLYSDFREAKVSVRNFYGPMRVEEVGEGDELRRRLTHGTIQHGSQYMVKKWSRVATSYYAESSGVGRAILMLRQDGKPQRVGIVGLGTGTVACYGRPGDEYVYYEINPLVETLARQYFTYLADNPAKTEVVIGDARLSLEREPLRGYDVLAVDAFSSDSIPIHLLTREALQLYFKHLGPQGLLAVHISNRYLDLQPVLRSYADAHQLKTVYIRNERDEDWSVNSATWVLMGAADHPQLRQLLDEGFHETDEVPAWFRPWSDDYSNLLSVLDPEELGALARFLSPQARQR